MLRGKVLLKPVFFECNFAVEVNFGLAIDCNRDGLIGCNEPAMDNNL